MATISLEPRAMKGKSPDDVVKVRFRVLDGRSVQLTAKTDIKATVRDLSKFELNGTLKKGVSIYNHELKESLSDEINVINAAFNSLKGEGFDINSESLAEKVDSIKHPKKAERVASPTLLPRFREYIDSKYDVSIATIRDYNVVYAILEKFLTINGIKEIKSIDFNKVLLEKFRAFCRDEHKYVKKHPYLYVNLAENNIPSAPRAENTLASKFKKVRAFFIELECNDEISVNPFRKLSKNDKRKFFREVYRDGIAALTFNELMEIKNAVLPESLIMARDAFLLQCYIGARISDFQSLTMRDVKICEGGFAVLRYTPQKTASKRIEVETPLVKSAYDIISKYNFDFSILNYTTGANGFNAKIKRIFNEVGINRELRTWNENAKCFDYVPLSDLASSKVARKTCVTLCVQHSNYENAAGLHSDNSEALKHYHDNSLMERYGVFCRAFGESNEPYINN